MQAAIIHHLIEVSASTAPAAPGVSVLPSSGGSFANHLQNAMETSQDDSSGVKSTDHAGRTVKQPSDAPSGKDIRSAKAANATASAPVASPILFASANGPSPTPVDAATQTGSPVSTDAASMALSWLTAMLPDLLSAKPANQGAAGTGEATSAHTARKPEASGTVNQQESSAEPAAALPREAASAANHPDPVRALTLPSAPPAADTHAGTVSAGDGAAPAQHAGEIQGVAQTAESAALSLLAKSTTAGAGALPSVIETMTHAVQVVAAGDGKASAAVISAAHSQAAAAPAAQAPTKDTASATGTSLTQPVAPSAASQGVKAVNGISSDAKNGASQDAQPKGSNTPAAPGAASALQGGTSAAVTNAAQAAANGFPAALSQSAATGNSQPHTSAPAQGGAQQPTGGEKIAVAMETPVGLPQTTVSAASLLQSQARSEMRVSVQTESMGAVELHAVLASGKLGASISVVSHEAHTLLNNELPALQQVLTDQNLRIDHLSVINAPMSNGAGAGDGRGFHSGDYSRPQSRDLRWYSPTAPVVRSGDDIAMPGSARRLSVRA